MYCKNNPKKTYTGLEPSPKGLGFCSTISFILFIKSTVFGSNGEIKLSLISLFPSCSSIFNSI